MAQGPAGARDEVDYLIIGGGFYGCCLALFLHSLGRRTLVVEAEDELLTHASRVNQARIHSGFHYPRSVLTAVKSKMLHRRFAEDFPEAVVDDFQMLYAIARRRSRVPAKRFYRMFADMGAPIAPADPSQAALFDPAMVEAAFACTEWAFDFSALRRSMLERIDACGIDLRLNTRVEAIAEVDGGVVAGLSSGREIRARFAFNVTYAGINDILGLAGLPRAAVKYELTEIALVEPPPMLAPYGVTVMDGPFFSAMPYPSEKLYSLTHVRYTPHLSWTSEAVARSPYDVAAGLNPASRHRHMQLDSARYLPCIAEATWKKSLFDVKAVLIKNEKDDGRPILYQRQPAGSRIISILGGKIDNIYDLFDLVRESEPEWRDAHDGHVLGRASGPASGPRPGRAATVPA